MRACDKEKVVMTIEKLIQQIKILDTDREEECPIGIISMKNWEWPQGVALFAMYLYYKQMNDEKILEFIKEWFDERIEEGLPYKNVNTMCPMLTLACIYEELKEEKYLPILKEWAEYAMYEMPRAGEGGIQHIVSGITNEGQIWDDTLYMTVLFVTKMGNILKKDEYIQESIRQFLVHIKYLTDVKTGLFFHGYTFKERHHFAKALWGRGNSWYTAGLVDYLEITDLEPGVKTFLIETLKSQVEALARLQEKNGLWHTLLDDPDSYLETSATAGFGYGILKAIRKGYIDEKYYEVGYRALEAVLNSIDEAGIVQGVSYGTPVFNTIEEYKQIPICPMPYGQSMALMILVEAIRHENLSTGKMKSL